MALGVTISHEDAQALITPAGELRVAQERYLKFEPFSEFFTNETFGSDLAQNVSFGGTPDLIYDGGDNVGWSISTLTGNAGDFDETSTDQAFTGTQSLEITSAENGDEIMMTRSSAINPQDYTAISGAIYIVSWATNGVKDHQMRFRLSGLNVSIPLNISAYVDTTLFNIWQPFSIPLSDFIIFGSVDEFIIESIDIGGGPVPDVYFDALQFEQTGEPLQYFLKPSGRTLHIEGLRFILADSFTGGVSYDKFMGLNALSTGLIFNVVQDDVLKEQKVFRSNIDLVSRHDISTETTDDGVTTTYVVDMDFKTPWIMTGSDAFNYMRFTVSDSLAGLSYFRIETHGLHQLS